MRGQAEIIIRGKVDYLLAIEGTNRGLLVVEHAETEVRAFGLEIVQLVGEIRERVRASGGSWHLVPRIAGRGATRHQFVTTPSLIRFAVSEQYGQLSVQSSRFSVSGRAWVAAARSARVFRLETSRSGLPKAALAAPALGRGEGRFTHTVAMPKDCAGITS